MGHKTHDPCLHAFHMEGVMTFVTYCTNVEGLQCTDSEGYEPLCLYEEGPE